jgi:hypothetical protein
MAVIAQADPLDRLVRKIGYSVGLEDLVDRVRQLVALYARDGAITATAFRDLVEKGFGRKNAVEHFANFYSQLNLVRAVTWEHAGGLPNQQKAVTIPKTLEPLYQLDSLLILRRMFPTDDTKYSTSLRVVLTQSIIEEDGDIFLNALLSDFQIPEIKARIESMIRTKRRLLSGVIRNPSVMSKINRIVNIKNESSRDAGDRKEIEPVGRFGKRTGSLSSGRRTQSLTSTPSDEILIPDDYLEKAKRTRGGWSEDLGLSRDGIRSDAGSRLIAELQQRRARGTIVSEIEGRPTAIFWGYKSDLERLRIDPKKMNAAEWEAWDLLGAIAIASWPAPLPPETKPPDADEVFRLLKSAFDLYRGSSTKGLIRNSLPLYVAEPVLAGWCVAEMRPLPDLEAILENEFNKKARRVQRMIIRGTSGALFFTKVTK